MKKQIIFTTIALSFAIQAQDYPPPTDLITIPTAGTLSRGSFSMDMRIQDGGGLITGLCVGITDRFQFCLSYGSPNLIGDDSLVWYPRPEAKDIPHNAHVDQHFPHIVGLYYPNYSDGDTFFFDDDLNVIHKEPVERGLSLIHI